MNGFAGQPVIGRKLESDASPDRTNFGPNGKWVILIHW
jgi:hypothetical protein